MRELSGGEALKAKRRLIARHGKGSGFYHDPEIRFFRFTPMFIRVLVKPEWPPRYEVIKNSSQPI